MSTWIKVGEMEVADVVFVASNVRREDRSPQQVVYLYHPHEGMQSFILSDGIVRKLPFNYTIELVSRPSTAMRRHW